MAEITATLVKELRDKTGAGILECKKALTEANGDMEQAITILRERGKAMAEQKASRIAREGIIYSYIHPPGKIGTLIELNCETDFVARNEEFRQLAKDLAMHITAMNPFYIHREDVPQDLVDKELSIYKAQAINEGKTPEIAEKIAQGKLEKFFNTVCLLEQPFFKDNDMTMDDVIKDRIAKIGENIVLRRYTRFVVGQSDEEPES